MSERQRAPLVRRAYEEQVEWLEADGRGGFASGTSSGVRTRRYHAWLLSATTPPTGRMVLVSGADAWMDGPFGRVAISTQRYAPDVLHPDGDARIVAFSHEPWPAWTYRVAPGVEIQQELFIDRESGATIVSWRPRRAPGVDAEAGAGVGGETGAGEALVLHLRPFLAARDYHGLQHENGAWRFDAGVQGERVTFSPYDGVPAISCFSNGRYRHAPDWYRRFLYVDEQARGLDAVEDLVSPGELSFAMTDDRPAVLVLTAGADLPKDLAGLSPLAVYELCRSREASRRARFADPLTRAADAYLVQRGDGQTIVAGYPWFTDWGRDTFIALRGLCLATGRLDAARDILTEWAKTVSEGMLPNRFPDGGPLEFNSVDASLWFVVSVHDFLASARRAGHLITGDDRRMLSEAVLAIVEGYARGTRFGIRQDADGLLAAGVHGQQLTWMDAKVGDWGCTPRHGKPVEINALWHGALCLMAEWAGKLGDEAASVEYLKEAGLVRDSFRARFWNEERSCLFDVINERGANRQIRPNQIFAVSLGNGLGYLMKAPSGNALCVTNSAAVAANVLVVYTQF